MHRKVICNNRMKNLPICEAYKPTNVKNFYTFFKTFKKGFIKHMFSMF